MLRPRVGRRVSDPGIFKAYDVRGLYGEQIDEDVAYRDRPRVRARARRRSRASRSDELRIGVGRDMRLSAPELAERYADGIRDEGATCSTSARSAPRCSISRSARASSTAA